MNKSARMAMPLVAMAAVAPLVGIQAADQAYAAGETTITAWTTGYTWFDNTPVGSAQIAHPVIHSVAGGTGTWSNPITLATAPGRYAFGTRFYVPSLHRYFIAEDIGGNHMYSPPSGTSAHLDLWMGGQGGSSSGADRCASAITGRHTVIVNPASDYVVQPGSVYDGGCHGGFSETPQKGNAVTSSTKAAAKTVTSSQPSKPTIVSRSFVRSARPLGQALRAGAALGKTVAAQSAKPAPKPVAKTVTAAKSTAATHLVKPGDTLSKVALANHTTWQRLFELNRSTLKSPNLLQVGQKLVLA